MQLLSKKRNWQGGPQAVLSKSQSSLREAAPVARTPHNSIRLAVVTFRLLDADDVGLHMINGRAGRTTRQALGCLSQVGRESDQRRFESNMRAATLA